MTMMNWRHVAAGAALSILVGLVPTAGVEAREMVRINFQAEPGTIVIRNSSRALYLVKGDGVALRYRVAVGMSRMQWEGTTFINGVHRRPAWSPPAIVRRDKPSLPNVIPGGSPRNPMGEGAMTLAGGEFAIHGTNMPGTIGRAASYGCFRMHNQDVLDLMARVGVGTRVVVTR